MKKLIIAFVALFCMTVSTSAMGYEQARDQALFLTDKMAYELNLTEAQYEAAYEINLDYLMGVNNYDDVYGTYWTRRNLDLSYILMDWQYQAFVNATYFYRPLWWEGGYWHFGIYARYPHRDYFYFGRPHFYAEYRGGHSWHHNGGRSWYHGRDFAGPGPQYGRQNGMRDGFQRGDYRGGQSVNRSFGNGQRPNITTQGNRTYGNQNNRTYGNQSNRSYGNNSGAQRPNTGVQQRNNSQSTFGGARNNNRQSSTRTTVTRPQQNNSSSSFGNVRSTTPRQSFTPRQSQSSPSRSSVSTPSRSSGSFGGSRSAGVSGGSRSGGSFGGGHSSGGSHSGGSSFGGRR